jgi:DnaJ-like protein
MVELPGTLERSTLGDVLGALHRYRVTGTLLLDESSSGSSHRHVIAWRDGLIHHVETTRPPLAARRSPLSSRHAAECWTEDDPRRSELLERLEALFELGRARLSFRVMGPRPPESSRPLGPRDFLHGRRRSRDVPGSLPRSAPEASSEPRSAQRPREPSRPEPPPDGPRARALRTLGLDGEPGADAVRAAFRQLARRWHPDRHPGANEHTRALLCRRFAQITVAYEALIGRER